MITIVSFVYGERKLHFVNRNLNINISVLIFDHIHLKVNQEKNEE